MLSLDELVGKISGESGKAEEEVKTLIKDKQTELSDLVSEEGAAYIVGRELGVELIKDTRRDLKIANILPEMRNVDIKARVSSVFEPKEFEKNGKKGIVAGVVLGDDSGTIRLPLWNDEAALIKTEELSEGDLVEVTGAWSKNDSYRDGAELRLGRRGRIKKLESGEPGQAPSGTGGGAQQDAVRSSIAKASPGMNVIIRGMLMQVYRKKPYFEVCPQCGSRATESGSSFTCKEHGTVTPVYNLLLTGVLDDGTGNMRVVFFRDQAEKIFGRGANDVKDEFMGKGLDSFWEGFPAIGKELVVEGRVKMNDFSKEPEILANSVTEVNVKEEAARMLSELGG